MLGGRGGARLAAPVACKANSLNEAASAKLSSSSVRLVFVLAAGKGDGDLVRTLAFDQLSFRQARSCGVAPGFFLDAGVSPPADSVMSLDREDDAL